MNLDRRIDLLERLGNYMLSDDPQLLASKEKASRENAWFTPEFVDLSVRNIGEQFLQKDMLERWVAAYHLPPVNNAPKKVGIVMAGNIPLVGFHDLLCVFIAGHIAAVKPSSKDDVLIRHLTSKLAEWENEVNGLIQFLPMLKNCDAYIATGSNNSAGYFEYYFKKYPHLIRRNRTSVAILTGYESPAELEKLADDVFLYFGLGCRNITKIYVRENYDFVPLLAAFKKYDYLADHHKYRNNYDYNLAIHLLNRKYYMSTKALLLIENTSLFSPVSQLNYESYKDEKELTASLENDPTLQCIAGGNFVPFGQTQCPAIRDYADGVDTMQFVTNL